ncbi:MAG: ABC transporter ATP-binding protein [Bacteroidota bacterium]|nr:ABC transporter ATP-binding protein [Bacteroidota bacterium]
MLLQIDNIDKSFYLKDGRLARKVLNALSMQVSEGESLAIVGPSGSGKTTLLNLIALLDKPDAGEIIISGESLSGLSGKKLDEYRNQSIGIVFQLHHLMPQLSLLENVLLPTLGDGNKNTDKLGRAKELLQRVGVWDQRHQKPGELSGGECQRAAVVRALINQPGLLLADEPTGALDEENAGKLSDLLMEIHREQGTALIMVTHSSELAAKMDRRLVLRNGQLEESK